MSEITNETSGKGTLANNVNDCGWSHLAQFSVAVENKDPKKSKFSDTLHQFWKKEHDWGWKKFIELPKLQNGFIDKFDSLVFKAQVQVIRECVNRPFRCLDAQYRKELLKVYLKDVEKKFMSFVEEKRIKLMKVMDDKKRWKSLCVFWLGMDHNARLEMSREKMDVILKLVVKHFFIKNEVTSTIVMDFLFYGLKSLEEKWRKLERLASVVARELMISNQIESAMKTLEEVTKKERRNDDKEFALKIKEDETKNERTIDAKEFQALVASLSNDIFVLVKNPMLLLERFVLAPLPEMGSPKLVQVGNVQTQYNMERDEKQLADYGRWALEVVPLSQVYQKLDDEMKKAKHSTNKRRKLALEDDESAAETEDDESAETEDDESADTEEDDDNMTVAQRIKSRKKSGDIENTVGERSRLVADNNVPDLPQKLAYGDETVATTQEETEQKNDENKNSSNEVAAEKEEDDERLKQRKLAIKELALKTEARMLKVMELEDESDFEKLLSSDNRISITGFGSLLSERSARSTFPDLENFRIAKLQGFRRVFAHSAPIFFERGIANPETKEISSLSVEPCEGESLVVTVFEIKSSEIPAFIRRELEFRFLAVVPETLEGKPYTNSAVLCGRYSDEEFFQIRCKGNKEIYFQHYGRFNIEKIWRDDILPCRLYLRHCVLAAKNLGDEAYNNFLDHTFLGDRKTTIREYLSSTGSGIMEEEPPEALKSRYGG
ncbi:unnamed protein product [Arabidopsis arenosa]|uniref:MATH domain-containing protein n=1 Tax=Arabidopsis arenosa TaxID=38785 RepID=A0A8S2AX70_ARAAE|nr:unnamed protein product [Arabidopsis arenosa]